MMCHSMWASPGMCQRYPSHALQSPLADNSQVVRGTVVVRTAVLGHLRDTSLTTYLHG